MSRKSKVQSPKSKVDSGQRPHHNRRGVILLVVMVLLALMTLLGLTLVLVTAQGRLSALATSRNTLQSEHDTEELTYARTQVFAGSTDPNSVFGAHGLGEDMYGLPQFFGQIMPNTTGVPSVVAIGETVGGAAYLAGGTMTGGNNGSLLQLIVSAGNVNTSSGAQIGLSGIGLQSSDQYVLPQNSGAFCGQVITMLTGPAQGQSARVVGYYYNAVAGGFTATMQVSSFGGVVPGPGDHFMINGRPFSGTGFGLDLTKFYGGAPGVWGQNVAGVVTATTGAWSAGNTPLLSAVEAFPAPLVQANSQTPLGQFYAYMPNHAQLALSTFQTGLPGYWDPAGPGGANEPYDAPDYQNLMLAMHYYSPFLLPIPAAGLPAPVGVITPIPSLHRPELVAWYYNQALMTATPAISMANPVMRRKVILRPEPTDNYFLDQGAPNGSLAGPNGVWDAREPWHDVNGDGLPNDAYADGTPAFLDINGDGVWTAGETDYSGNTFNPVTGCWFIAANGGWALDTNAGLDVDNDKDGIPDSIWVDGGLPVHTEADGTLTKNMIAVLCIDLDGKVNLNAHGTLAQLDTSRYPGGSVSGPVGGSGGTMSLYSAADSLFQRNAPVGQGFGPADVNPLHLFVRSHSPTATLPSYTYSNGATPSAGPAHNYYRTFLQGYDYQTWLQGYNGIPVGYAGLVMQVDGRYGESSRLTVPPTTVAGFNFPGVFPRGSYNVSYLTAAQQLLNGPRAGWSQWFDPASTTLLTGAGYANAYWVNDPVALARFSDLRPGLLTPPSPSGTPFFFDFLDAYLPGTTTPAAIHLPTGYGAPSDLHSRGVLTTDLAGRPYYAGTLTFPWQVTGLPQPLTSPGIGWQAAAFTNYWSAVMTDFAASEYGAAAEAVLAEHVDTQYEMDLTQNARQAGEFTGNTSNGIPDYASVDAKITPSELEGILRTFEQGAGTADSSTLLQRLNNLETANSLSSTSLFSLLANKDTTIVGAPSKISPRNDIRLAVTSESWDLPMPNLALTPQQMADVVQYVDYYEATPQLNWLANPKKMLNLNNIGLVDLLRARIFADNFDPVTTATNPQFPLLSVISGADTSIFGNLKNIQPNVGVAMPVNPVWPLLAPETVLGMRLDVNRALGNGNDDNGNGVVDEPWEVLWQDAAGRGEYLVYPFSKINNAIPGPAGQVNNGVILPPSGEQQNDMLGILDLNNDGFYAPSTATGLTSIDPQLTVQTGSNVYLPADITLADMRARQLLARHLYCLAMLLLDDRPNYNAAAFPPAIPPAGFPYGASEGTIQNVLAQIFSATGPASAFYNLMSAPTGTPYYNNIPPLPSLATTASREQAAYVIAQWAVNVVDFRDRDSIMTPFEFDLYPFRADPYVTADPNWTWVQAIEANITWNVDDIIDPLAGAVVGTGTHNDDTQVYRGIVWGCERPELLMTETVAFHDRGTADTTNAQMINDPQQNPAMGPDTVTTNLTAMPYDKDFDQVRRPRGTLIAELYNPTNYWDAPQADMQQPWQTLDANGNRGMGVNLAQVAVGQPPTNAAGITTSPVWRMVVAYSPWQTNESLCYQNTPTGAVPPIGGGGYTNSPVQAGNGVYVDQRVPVLPPGTIHRAIYFTPFNPLFVTPNAAGNAWLATVGDTLLNNSFFADPGVVSAAVPNLLLPPGQYAVVGPANQNPTTGGAYNVYAGQNSTTGGNTYPWSLQLALAASTTPVGPNPSIAYLYGAGGSLQGPYASGYTGITSTSASIKPAIGVPIQTNWYSSSGAGTPYAVYAPHTAAGTVVPGAAISTTLRMSVSEPEHGYPVWYGGAVTTATANGAVPTQLWDDATYSAAAFGSFPQHPYDSAQGNPSGGNYLQFGDLPNPYVAPGGGTAGTTLGYTVLYLQRLANPLQAWDQKMNPYITVDSMPVDLTAYTGETGTAELATYYSSAAPINQPNPQPTGYAKWTASGGTTASFDTRRRGYDPAGGGATTLLADQSTTNIWTPLPTNGANVFAGGNYGASGKGTLASPMPAAALTTGSSLGWINYEYTTGGAYYATGSLVPANNPTASIGTSGLPPYMYNGDPIVPIPWLAWNNRPYVSQFELMLVPASSPSSQLQDFGMLGWNGGVALNQYQPYSPLLVGPTPGQILTPKANSLPAAQFIQLLNFVNNEQSVTTNDVTNLLPNLYRVFEFLQVPSRYTGTQELLNPSQFAGDDAISTVAGITSGVVNLPASHLFHPPFNWLPRYREPGKINLNTIFDPVVFQSLMDDYPGTMYASFASDTNPVTGSYDAMVWPRGLWASLTRSRQGFYEDPRRPYLWGAQLMPGPYTVNSVLLPTIPVAYAVPNPSAPPNPVSQFAFNTSVGVPGINADIPTYFANPFRPDGAAAFVPPADTTVTPTVPLTPLRLMHQWSYPGGLYNGVNATLLRSQEASAFLPTVGAPPTMPVPPWLPTPAVSSTQQMTALESIGQSSFPSLVMSPTVTATAPLSPASLAQFDDTAFDLNNAGATYNNGTNVTPYRHAGRNASFQYQMLNRLGNTTTNRSNVYAVWITLGKFQVQAVAPSPTNPDGYKLVQPYLDSTGNQVQTRGFYIFDRSIPMGFQRGQDINIEKGLLVERVLQVAQ